MKPTYVLHFLFQILFIFYFQSLFSSDYTSSVRNSKYYKEILRKLCGFVINLTRLLAYPFHRNVALGFRDNWTKFCVCVCFKLLVGRSLRFGSQCIDWADENYEMVSNLTMNYFRYVQTLSVSVFFSNKNVALAVKFVCSSLNIFSVSFVLFSNVAF